MIDMTQTIVPKSDQLNADDLIGRTLTIKVTKVLLSATPEQPVAIHFEGDGNKPYMACKSMRRVLVNVWGPDATAYTGRSMTLYRDPSVKFGGLEVGGIRISHMSHIEAPVTMALTATRAQRKPFTVKPLDTGKHPTMSLAEWIDKTLPTLCLECASHDDVAKLQSGKVYQAAWAKASETVRADMLAHVTTTLERLDAAGTGDEPPPEC